MMERATGSLPSRGQTKWQAMQQDWPRDDDSYTFEDFLEEAY